MNNTFWRDREISPARQSLYRISAVVLGAWLGIWAASCSQDNEPEINGGLYAASSFSDRAVGVAVAGGPVVSDAVLATGTLTATAYNGGAPEYFNLGDVTLMVKPDTPAAASLLSTRPDAIYELVLREVRSRELKAIRR